jgi:hypothetical protein
MARLTEISGDVAPSFFLLNRVIHLAQEDLDMIKRVGRIDPEKEAWIQALRQFSQNPNNYGLCADIVRYIIETSSAPHSHSGLTVQDAKILDQRYGITDGKPKDFDLISKEIATSKSRATYLGRQAILKFNYPLRSTFAAFQESLSTIANLSHS